MFEVINGTETNYIYNSDIYTDTEIGEIDTAYEVDLFENENIKIMICPCVNVDHPLEIKVYRKNSEIFEICRLNFFKNEYIYSKYDKSFKLNLEDINLINDCLRDATLQKRFIYWTNYQLAILRSDNSIFNNVEISVNNLPLFTEKINE